MEFTRVQMVGFIGESGFMTNSMERALSSGKMDLVMRGIMSKE